MNKRLAYLFLLTAFWSTLSFAENTFSDFMQSMKSAAAIKTAYQETRTLELMDKPWQGSGYMYSLPPDIMIREQLKPRRLLMGIKGNKMFYYDPEQGVYHQSLLQVGNLLALNIGVFKALVTADEALLYSLYEVFYSSHGQQWQLILKDKKNSDSGFKIQVSGLKGQAVDRILVKQADGDVNMYVLKPVETGAIVEREVQQLIQELKGEKG